MDDKLKLHVEAIENLNDEIKGLSDDRKDRYSLAKGEGYDTKVVKAVIARRAIERAAVTEFDALVETYECALGIV